MIREEIRAAVFERWHEEPVSNEIIAHREAIYEAGKQVLNERRSAALTGCVIGEVRNLGRVIGEANPNETGDFSADLYAGLWEGSALSDFGR